jgi:signal transduction histidine kinase/FixJ family two-component response regulator
MNGSLSARDEVVVESDRVDERIRLLLAEENPELREHLARLLRRWWSIETVGDSAAALEAIRRRRPTLVLADAAMPGPDGIRLLHALRDDPVTRSIPIIVLSQRGTSVETPYPNDCLIKPFSSRELIARVSARLEEHFGTAGATQRPVRRLLNKIGLPIAVLRRKEFIVENANRAYFGLAGGSDAIGKPFAEPPLDGTRSVREESARALASGAPHIVRELALPVRRNGEPQERYWNFVFAPIEDERNLHDRHVVAIGVEVTDDVRLRQRREALAAEAIRANLAKDQFLATLGHELRNPLSPILTALQLMRTKGLSCHELDVVERQVGAIVHLVDDLMDLSRIGRGQIELQKEHIEIADVVARAIETVDPLLKEHLHRLILLVPEAGLRVKADPSRMAQVVSNLLTNAAKYSERGSEITVRAVRDDGRLRLSVEDQGLGIAPDMLPHVFEPFAQERSVVDRSRGGLGLGLAIVRNLVQLHGGTVKVHSDGLGTGSTFCVELPMDESESV